MHHHSQWSGGRLSEIRHAEANGDNADGLRRCSLSGGRRSTRSHHRALAVRSTPSTPPVSAPSPCSASLSVPPPAPFPVSPSPSRPAPTPPPPSPRRTSPSGSWTSSAPSRRSTRARYVASLYRLGISVRPEGRHSAEGHGSGLKEGRRRKHADARFAPNPNRLREDNVRSTSVRRSPLISATHADPSSPPLPTSPRTSVLTRLTPSRLSWPLRRSSPSRSLIRRPTPSTP